MILLGYDEGNDHLPQILVQDPDPSSIFCRRHQIRILSVHTGYDRGIIRLQVKIISPHMVKLLLCAVKRDAVPCLRHLKISVKGDQTIPVVTAHLHSETLAGIADL